MPHPNQAPLTIPGGRSLQEFKMQRPGEDPPVQPPPPSSRRPPDTRSFWERYDTAAATGALGAAPAAAVVGMGATPLAGALVLGSGALGGIAEQATRDIAPEWSEDYPWLAPAVGIAASGGIGGVATGARFAMQHGPTAVKAAAGAVGAMGLSAAASTAAYGAGLINLATHAVTFGTPAALATAAAIGTGLWKGVSSGVPRFAQTYVGPMSGALAEQERNRLFPPPQPPPPAAEADIPLRPWEDTLPADRRTRLQADPNAAGQ